MKHLVAAFPLTVVLTIKKLLLFVKLSPFNGYVVLHVVLTEVKRMELKFGT